MTRTNLLDSLIGGGYKAALVATVVALLGPFQAQASSPPKGVVLPPGSTQVGENRFRSSSNYADTVTFYGKAYKQNPRKTIVNQPGIRGFHIVNTEKGEWEGLNVYEFEGETRIFIVPRDPEKPEKKAEK